MAEHSIAQVVSTCASKLTRHQGTLTFNEPLLEAKIIVGFALNRTPTQLIIDSDVLVTDADFKSINGLIDKRLSGEPIAYITGHQPFWTLDLEVSKHTLIPRADTETLVESALKLPLQHNAEVLDLGTGTGAVALSIANERPNWKVLGIDFKSEIVELAARNALKHSIKCSFVQSDWYASLTGMSFDLIVSNPPYVEEDSPYLNQGDLRFEPMSALTSEDNGLADIKHIINEGKRYLNDGGYMALEHGAYQAEAIRNIFNAHGYSNVKTIKDLNKLDRVTLAVFDTLL